MNQSSCNWPQIRNITNTWCIRIRIDDEDNLLPLTLKLPPNFSGIQWSSVTESYDQVMKLGQKIPEYFAHVDERAFRNEVRKTSDIYIYILWYILEYISQYTNRYIVIYTLVYVAGMRYVGRLCIRLSGLPFSCNVSVTRTRSGLSHHFEFLIHWYMFTWTIFM